jgi:hypothetical protein
MSPIYLTEGENYPGGLGDVIDPFERLLWLPALRRCYERLKAVSPEKAEAFRHAVSESWILDVASPLAIPSRLSVEPIPAVEPVVVAPVTWPSDPELDHLEADLFAPAGDTEWNFGEDLDAFAPDACYAGFSPDDLMV